MNQRKLLLVTRDVDGGLGQHFVDLAEGMVARGWEVHCIRAERTEEHVTGHSAHLDHLTGVTLHTIPMARSIGPNDLRSYLAFRQIVQRYGPFDIAHGHGAKGGVFVRLPCRGIKASVYTPHGFITVDPEIDWHKKFLYGTIEGFLARFSTKAMLILSNWEREEALRLGAPVTACHWIPNGMTRPDFLSRDQARAELGLDTKEQVALFVGRFCYAKAPERFIDLLANLARDRPTLRGVLIGGGNCKQKLVDRAIALNVADRLLVFETKRAASYMPAADLIVIPSRYEGFSYTMLEALAAGLPIVSYDVSGADDLLLDTLTGYIVKQGDPQTLALRAAKILDNQSLRTNMSAAARARFETFKLPNMLEKIADVYDRLRPAQAQR